MAEEQPKLIIIQPDGSTVEVEPAKAWDPREPKELIKILRAELWQARADNAALMALLREVLLWDTTHGRSAAQVASDWTNLFDRLIAALSTPHPGQPLLDRLARLTEALKWLVNLGYGVGRAGGAPGPCEIEAALDEGKAALVALKGDSP